MKIINRVRNWLKNRWLKKEIEFALTQRDRSQINAKCQILGVIVDEQLIPEFDVFYDWYQDFNIAPKDIIILTFLEVKKKLPTIRQNQLTNADFDWQGQINHPGAIEFMNSSFDILIAIYKPGNTLLDLIVARSKSKFKVGSKGLDIKIFDLILEVPPDRLALMRSEFVKYMGILNKKL